MATSHFCHRYPLSRLTVDQKQPFEDEKGKETLSAPS